MIRLVILAVAAFLVANCNNKANPVVEDDGPVPIVEAEKPVGTPIWRKACYRLTHPNATEQPDSAYFEIPIEEETDTSMISCLKGFMALPGDSPDDAAKCIMDATDQETMFKCMQGAIVEEHL